MRSSWFKILSLTLILVSVGRPLWASQDFSHIIEKNIQEQNKLYDEIRQNFEQQEQVRRNLTHKKDVMLVETDSIVISPTRLTDLAKAQKKPKYSPKKESSVIDRELDDLDELKSSPSSQN